MFAAALLAFLVLIAACGQQGEEPVTLEFPWTGGRCIEIRDDQGELIRWAGFGDAVRGEWRKPPPDFGSCRLDFVSGDIKIPTDMPDGDYQICTAVRTDCQTYNLHSLGRS